jgi:bla regulator protein blaR1
MKFIALVIATIGFANALSQPSTASKMEFDVASIKQNKSDAKPVTNFPTGPEDARTPSGGSFSGSGVTPYQYISLAYDFTVYDYQLLKSRLPEWVLTDRFDIQARASGNPTKAQMRLMMQSLLADRFKLAIHFETREVPVFALVLAKPGKTGPQLHPHSDEPSCSTASPCGFDSLPNPPGQFRIGARNVTMGFIANVLATSELGRPVLDQTKLAGNFDFTLEWTPNIPASPDFTPDQSGPTYIEALKEQLGLKLESARGPIQVPVIDRVERPDEN